MDAREFDVNDLNKIRNILTKKKQTNKTEHQDTSRLTEKLNK